MNKLLFLFAPLTLLCSCHDLIPIDDTPQITPVIPELKPTLAEIELSFIQTQAYNSGEEYASHTHSSSDQPRDVNIYIYSPATDAYFHDFAVQPDLSIKTFIPEGDCTICCVGNMGYDIGDKTWEQLRRTYIEITDQAELAPQGRQLSVSVVNTTIRDKTAINIKLERLAARISLTVKLDVSMKTSSIISVTPYNMPSQFQLFGDSNKLGQTDPAIKTTYDNLSGSALREYSFSYYQFENMQDDVTDITTPKDRNPTTAPISASYIVIRVKSGNTLCDYYVYPGQNQTSDFGVRRNTHYRYDITIFGTNPSDLRVSQTEVIFWAGQQDNGYKNYFEWQGNTAYAVLRICTNNCPADSELTLSYEVLGGTFKESWYMQGFGTYYGTGYRLYKPQMTATVQKGNGTAYLYLRFTNTNGSSFFQTTDNRFAFTLHDTKGAAQTYIISTNPTDKQP